MGYSWLSLLPPLIVIISVCIWRKLNIALLSGIIAATIIATQFSLPQAFQLLFMRFSEQLGDPDKLYLYSFLFAIGILIALFSKTGCAQTFANIVSKRLRTATAAQTSSILLSFLLFIDDYLSILTTGYVMRDITDRFGIPRAKLAFLVHSLAGAVVILVPVSSWVATINSYLKHSGVSPIDKTGSIILADPFYLYLKAIPFTFYSFLIIASVIFIVHQHISYGPMHKLELKSKMHEHLTKKEFAFTGNNSAIIDLLIPLITLVGTVMIGIPYAGGYYLLGGTHTLIESFKHNEQTFLIMFVASIVALLTAFCMALIRKSIIVKNITPICINGYKLMQSAVVMVFLAATLSVMLKDDLQTGTYLATIFMGSVSLKLFPLMVFIVSLLSALVTGSAWGTLALMIALAIPMTTSLMQLSLPTTLTMIPLIGPVLGAIFSGAVCGDHISPLSETTIMTATSTGIAPLKHVYTQFPYTIPAIISTAVAFLMTGFLIDYPLYISILAPLGSALLLCFTLLIIGNKIKK